MASFKIKRALAGLRGKKKKAVDIAWKAELNPSGLVKDAVVKTAKNPISITGQVLSGVSYVAAPVVSGPAKVVLAGTPFSSGSILGEKLLKKKFPKYEAATEKLSKRLEGSKKLDKISNYVAGAGRGVKNYLQMFSDKEEVIHGKDWTEVIRSKNTKHSKKKSSGFVLQKPGLNITSSSSSSSYTNYD